MGRTHTTTDGFRLEVYSTLYMDWGLSISFEGKELFTSPCCLSNECYGRKPNPEKFDDWDEAERATLDGDDDAFVPWTDEDWQERLAVEAETLIEAFLGDDIWPLVELHKEAKEWAFLQVRSLSTFRKTYGLHHDPTGDELNKVLTGLAAAAAAISPFMEDEEDILDDLHEHYEKNAPKVVHDDPRKLAWLAGREFTETPKGYPEDPRRQLLVPCGNGVELSIAVGGCYYSSPRALVSWSEYTEVEVGVLREGGLVSPESLGVTDEELLDLFEYGGSPLAAYVPVGRVPQLADAITNTQKEG